ncbi:hypothetical protein A7A76_16745 [Lysobacter enzymogenes]|uniref:ATP-binding protein n=1 Tax=Lysobacter enzymogenes TaxID=69 RepID=UPI0019D31937|nr:ATP-binding protein [Lysobacter enzymogenes]MBN7136386.1 hypothetical protein [Lysobacter enzymogenes]
MNSDAQVFQLSDLPDPKEHQFRMRRLSVVNWGTFSGLHRMPISSDGTLLLGPSGAGKSTLLDAISALTVPPRAMRFNAAADEGSRKDPDRNLMSYVRGAWADKADEESSRSIAKQYLRTDATWSAIALEYANRAGRHITLVRWLWTQHATSSANSKLNSHFMVAETAFDLGDALSFSGNRRELTKKFQPPLYRHHEASFASYAEHWCRLMGIDNVEALELLHQTQSTKNLGDLNAFLRDFMLPEPATFDIADQLVTEFSDLDEAHRAVVNAREQIETLAPARDQFELREKTLAEASHLNNLLAGIPAFRACVQAKLLREENVLLKTTIDNAVDDAERAKALTLDADRRLRALREEHLIKGGAKLSDLNGRREQLVEERSRIVEKVKSAEKTAKALGWVLGADQQTFVSQLQQAGQWLLGVDEQAKVLEELKLRHALAEDKKLEEFKWLQTEIRSLEQTGSSIPDAKQQIRWRLCQDLSIPLSRAPFAGELIDVDSDHEDWAGAVNRLLGGFGVTLLVQPEDQRKVAHWVDKNHLNDRWTYMAVESIDRGGYRKPAPQSVLAYVNVREHALRDWIWRHLLSAFDYERVDNASDLLKGERRITRAGQIRRSGRLLEKDDRHDINDKKKWVLGDIRAKLTSYKDEAARVGADIDQARSAKEKAAEEAKILSDRKLAATLFSQLRWKDIDVASVVLQIGQVEEHIKRALEDNPVLTDLEGRMRLAEQEKERHQRDMLSAQGLAERSAEKIEENDAALVKADMEAAALPASHREDLGARFAPDWSPSLKSLWTDVEGVEKIVAKEEKSLLSQAGESAQKILSSFQNFLQRWPEEGGELQASLSSAPDFFAKLQRVEVDGLPQHEERFLDLLSKQSMQRLAELNRHLVEAKKNIQTRLDDVNMALETVPYNPDSFIQIRVQDLGLEEPREFRRVLAELFSRHNQGETAELAEAQFIALRKLILDLKAEDPAKRRWRETVLDVRKHVEFVADELEQRSRALIENYGGGGGKSGGQRQKLTATCLAAALRFQLGGSDGGDPSYAAVVLDEAFTKTDNDFTATCMRIFTELGFQMIVATPIKSVMTLEEFVGGATFVSIRNRQVSSLLHIDYDQAAKRLKLPEVARRSDGE